MYTNVILAGTLAVIASATPLPNGPGSWSWGGWGGGSPFGGGHGGHGPSGGAIPDQVLRSMPIKRAGGELQLAGKKWSAAGANVYWLGLDENVIPPAGQPFYAPYNASYPTLGRITEMMNVVRELGGSTIRSQTLGVSVGNPLSLWPTLTTRNPQAFDTIDWAVYQAGQHGLRLQMPLVDNYDYYHGGKFVFLRWFGLDLDTTQGYSSIDPRVQQFYTNETIIAGFKSYIEYLLTHKNKYNGLTYAEDPTVAIIETGNELSGPVFGDMNVPTSWINEIGTFVKALPGASNKLFLDGTYGINSTHFSLSIVDIFSDHFYPRNITKLRAGVAAVASTNRVYLADEYDWTSTSGDSLPSFLSAIEDEFKNSVLTGDKFWSLFGHNVGATNGCNVFVNHTDGFTFHYGDASTPSNVTLEREEVRQHLWRLQGQEVGLAEPAVGCPGPEYESGTPYLCSV